MPSPSRTILSIGDSFGSPGSAESARDLTRRFPPVDSDEAMLELSEGGFDAVLIIATDVDETGEIVARSRAICSCIPVWIFDTAGSGFDQLVESYSTPQAPVTVLTGIAETERAISDLSLYRGNIGRRNLHAVSFRSLTTGSFIVSAASGRVFDVNRAAADIFGVRRSHFLGRRLLSMAPFADHAMSLRRALSRAATGNSSEIQNIPMSDHSGWILDLKLQPSGDDSHVIVVCQRRAVTSQGKSEKNLAEDILNRISNIVLVGDGRGEIIYASKAVEKILGYSVSAVLGDGWWRLTREDDLEAERERQFIARCARGEERISTSPYEAKVIDARGQKRYILWSDARGTGDVVIGIGSDITRRKEMEQQLLETNQKLEEQSRKLESANRELDAFAHSVSHDLRGPLHRVSAYAEMLHEEVGSELDESAELFLARISTGCSEMGNLIENLLNFARMHDEKPVRKTVPISEIVSSLVGEKKEQMPERHVEFDVQPDLQTDADPVLVKIVLDNLLRNALKFTATRPVARITFGQEQTLSGPMFFIRDNGVGFDPQKADKLFRPFERLHTDKNFRGTGVGLTIVRRIIRRHGGLVRAESRPDEGATFWFTFSPPTGNGI